MEAIDKKQEAWLDSIFPPIEAWYVKGRKFLLDRGFHEESTLNNFVCGYDTSKGYCTITFYADLDNMKEFNKGQTGWTVSVCYANKKEEKCFDNNKHYYDIEEAFKDYYDAMRKGIESIM